MIYVLGLGNVLMGDDGLGSTVVREFTATYAVGAGVEVVDLGTPGLDLMPWLYDTKCVVLVDAVKSDAAPGTLRVYGKADILRHSPSVRVSPHDPGVKEALLALEFAGHAPKDVVLIGVVPLRTEMSLELSAPVRGAVPAAVAALVAVLEGFGAAVACRTEPLHDNPWWSPPVPSVGRGVR